MIFDHYGLEEIEEYLKDIIDDIRHGYSQEQIAAKLSMVDFDELHSIARARIKNERDRKIKEGGLFYTVEDLRFATNDEVARYRARRLRCKTLVEVGCGIGIQSIAFAEECEKLYCIEVDKRKLRYAQENAKQMGITNITFIEGDALQIVGLIPQADIVFCEPERAAEEKERKLNDMRPNVKELIRRYSVLTSDFCIELPPQMRTIELPGEKEYLSVNGELNRLNLYQGKLQQAEVSAVLLPANHRLELQKGDKMKKVPASKKVNKYLYDVDEAVAKAGLMPKLWQKGLYQFDAHLTSNALVQNQFFKATYDLVWRGPYNHQKIIEFLRKQKIGKVILRMNIRPEKYWEERKSIEQYLTGERSMHLFVFGKEACVGRVL